MEAWEISEKEQEIVEAFLEMGGAGLPSAAETGFRPGDILVGVCDCNWGLIIRTAVAMLPCYDPHFVCHHTMEDAFNPHNFVVLAGFRPDDDNGDNHSP